ncbi:hypothetical protein [Legionella drancourtii]|uniref:Uncharacterized protein n=1 Tax=Legionella drancourtii LLAP12 TaxID=658187 RepID=G9ERB4_9GAMM|nr:hypothetical protein [Legionella drancourtii]EHL30083.1 hypothetical protein LDG_7826 [Legionella drancourtii LLAP12]
MTHLVSDMTRLRFEITKGHKARIQLMDDLQHFADDLSCEVTKTLHSFTELRKRKAKHAAAERRAFVVDLQHKVKNFRDDFVMEFQNARCGWLGESPSHTFTSHAMAKPKMKKKN